MPCECSRKNSRNSGSHRKPRPPMPITSAFAPLKNSSLPRSLDRLHRLQSRNLDAEGHSRNLADDRTHRLRLYSSRSCRQQPACPFSALACSLEPPPISFRPPPLAHLLAGLDARLRSQSSPSSPSWDISRRGRCWRSPSCSTSAPP